ncbi:MAG: leucine-rich repeat protein, partial [Alistipes sp.]|nr:leucine-rich repeat protein [Alistipes sp.]
YGFLKELTDNGTYAYTFIGLYTVGADKGDAVTFGYDDEAYKDSLISLEGSDHTPLAIGFDYPWSATRYSSANEAMGAILSGSIEKGWEVSEAGGFATDEASDETNIQSLLNAEFKPAYDMVYGCAPFIEGVTTSLEEINANISAWQKAHTAKEFYTDGVYDIYYYDRKEGKYKPNGINLLTQFPSANIGGLTLEEKTALFIQLRKEYFKAHISDYFHLEDALFCLAFLLIFGATDNFKKNSYPYKFARLSDGGKWRWRQDDLDTILDINNQGFAVKAYSILMGDITASESVFKGEDSVFWSLLAEVFAKPDESNPNLPSLQSMVIRILDKMAELCPASYGTNKMERLVGYVRSAFWDYAQNYFPQSAYNEDASWTYEEAWGIYGTKYQNNVHPLQQSLGGHYEAERRWVEMRMIFIASMFGFADFAVGSSEKSLGQINYRVVGTDPVHYNIVPAIDINPTILIGDSRKIEAGERVMAGDVAELVVTGAGDADTTVYIQGADYIRDLGDLRGLKMVANTTLTVASARLQSLKIGDEVAENVTSNVGALNIGSCPSLEHIDARNVVSLGGAVSLNGCPRVKEALFAGSSINSLAIPEGSKIESISLPPTIQALSLVRLNKLKATFKNLTPTWINGAYVNIQSSGESIAYASNWRYCDYYDVSDLKSIFVSDIFHANTGISFYNSSKTRIKYYTSTEIGVSDATQAYDVEIPIPEGAKYMRMDSRLDAVHALYTKNLTIIYDTLANVSYLRVENCEGLDEFDLLEGAFSAEGSALRSVRVIGFDHSGDATDLNMLATLANGNYIGIDANGRNDEASLPVIEGTIHITDPVGEEEYNAVVGAFPALTLDAPNIVRYIKFADPVVAQICADNWGDKVGITKEQAASVTSLGGKFRNNTVITEFDELEKFTGVNYLGQHDTIGGNGDFQSCTNLLHIKLPKSVKILKPESFYGCTSLTSVGDLSNITRVSYNVFRDCALRGDIYMPNLTGGVLEGTFRNSGIDTVSSLGSVTSIGGSNQANGAFRDCKNLTKVVLPPTVTYLGIGAFEYCSSLKEINLEAVESISAEAFWGCTSLEMEVLALPNLKSIGASAFRSVPIKRVVDLGQITSFPTPYNYGANPNFGDLLEVIILPISLTEIGGWSFRGYRSLSAVICKNTTPPTCGSEAFIESSIASGTGSIYVPDNSVVAYRGASNWSSYASRIFPISQLETDNKELFNEIYEYIKDVL